MLNKVEKAEVSDPPKADRQQQCLIVVLKLST